MLLIEYAGHMGHRSLTDGHLGRHLEYLKTLNDARVASVGFIEYSASTTRINKEKNFKIKFQVILVFYRTNDSVVACVYIRQPPPPPQKKKKKKRKQQTNKNSNNKKKK